MNTRISPRRKRTADKQLWRALTRQPESGGRQTTVSGGCSAPYSATRYQSVRPPDASKPIARPIPASSRLDSECQNHTVRRGGRRGDHRTADDLQGAFDVGGHDRADALLTTAESIFFVNSARVSELAARNRLPAIYPWAKPESFLERADELVE